jgi:hypothetical protein
MGTVPKAETKRDKSLIADYLKETKSGWKYSIPQLGVKYARIDGDNVYPLTPTRIHQILDKYGVKKNRAWWIKRNKGIQVLDKSKEKV